MTNAAQEDAAHGDVDHGFGDVDALLEVADEVTPSCNARSTQRRGRTLKPGSPEMQRTTSITKSWNAACP